jgi:hypothetical protein
MASERPSQTRQWQDLAREAANETDPKKLVEIVKDLCSLLDEQKKPPVSSRDRNDQPEQRVQK